jgi:hypothetical protein
MKKLIVAVTLVAGVAGITFASLNSNRKKATEEKKVEKKMEKKKKKDCSRICPFS